MIKADVFVTNRNWKKYIKVPNLYINKKLKKIEKQVNIFKKNNLSFTILLSGDDEVKKLNRKFKKKNKTTDVLSFPSYEKKVLVKLLKKEKSKLYLGDIIINLNKVIKQIKDNNFVLNFDKIWIHGLVHLLGYRHHLNKDFSTMQKIENKIIRSLK
jgi:probable rRNA maturation factor